MNSERRIALSTNKTTNKDTVIKIVWFLAPDQIKSSGKKKKAMYIAKFSMQLNKKHFKLLGIDGLFSRSIRGDLGGKKTEVKSLPHNLCKNLGGKSCLYHNSSHKTES